MSNRDGDSSQTTFSDETKLQCRGVIEKIREEKEKKKTECDDAPT